ncbi:MAG: ferric reductase-like transmembrane domain-containing protein [Myxococcales bacterium]|nr:ferric reductase-like transmembrane domain-containing protein [Myxococcales bacterium]
MPTSSATATAAPLPAPAAPAAPAPPTFDASFARRFAWLCGLTPLAVLAWDTYRGQLGVNAVNYAIRTTGLLGLVCLVASLAITPLRRLTGAATLVAARRPLGLLGFGYIALHFAIFFWFDRDRSVGSTIDEVFERRYLQVGMGALLAMVPLAITSTDRMISRLGPRRWKALHRLAYAAAIGGVVHYYLLVKADTRQPRAFAVVLGGLLLLRMVGHYLDLRAKARRASATAAAATTPAPGKAWRGTLKVARVFDESPDVRTFRLVAPDGGPPPFTHRPGQYLTLELTIDGQRVFRSYTIASSPTRAGAIEITVKRQDGGRGGSRHVHATLVEGALVSVRGPHGDFVFDGAGADHVVLIAGGVGITPVMAMLRSLTDRAWPGRIDLLYGVRTARDVVFAEELAYLEARFPTLHVTRVASSPDVAPAWPGARGHIDRAILAAVPGLATAPIYMCGPAPMMAAVTTALVGLGVPAAAIHTEAFAAGAPPLVDAVGGDVAFARSGKRASGLTVLDAAEACGVDLPSECRAGICGQCKTKVVRGEVRMGAVSALSARERTDGYILACQAHPVSEIVVDA